MAIKNFTDLTLLKLAFKNYDAKIKEISSYLPVRDSIPQESIDEQLKIINRRFKFQLKNATIDLYTNNKLILLGNSETVKVPLLLPAWLRKNHAGDTVVHVNLTPYIPRNIENLDNRKLYGFMQYGTAMYLARENDLKLTASNTISKEGAVLYAKMMTKIFDRVASISLDKIRLDQVRYVFAKYFLINLLGKSPDNNSVEIYAKQATTNTATDNILNQFENVLAATIGATSQEGLYSTDLLNFISNLSKSTPWLSKVSARIFVQDFMTLFNPSAILATESLAYFLATLSTLEVGAEIIKSYSFDPLFGKEGEKLVAEFYRLVK